MSVALAIDLGASGGRAVAGWLDDGQLVVREVHRFSNDPVRAGGRLHWDVLRLLHEILAGIRAARAADLGEISSLGIDSWGCDFGLLDRHGELAGNPYHYRDQKLFGAMEAVLARVPAERIFARTGVQFLSANTLYQLYASQCNGSSALAQAARLLLMPDLMRYFLTGEQTSEYTYATTTQFLNIHTSDWDRELLRELDLPDDLLAPLIPPCTPGGHLLPALAAEIGCAQLPVIAVASHDTASAVLGTPGRGQFAYLSCGTWSLLGTELDRPIVNQDALQWNFTNEGGVGDTYRLLKNVTGLWLVEGCRRAWQREGIWPGYEAMAGLTLASPPFLAFIDPNDARFLNPPDMPRAIAEFCRDTGQDVPCTPAETMRCVLESLSLAYRFVLERTEMLSQRQFSGLHVVGGGVQNRVLLQFTANAIGRPVWAGPAEATAIGNILGQFLAAGEISSVAEGRELVRAAFPETTYDPSDGDAWDDAYHRYLSVAG